jgi:hypothetical protein
VLDFSLPEFGKRIKYDSFDARIKVQERWDALKAYSSDEIREGKIISVFSGPLIKLIYDPDLKLD